MIVIGLVAACSASPSLYYGAGVPVAQYYSGLPYYYHQPSAVVSAIKSQYHTQNELGQYAYGYNDGLSSKSETKHANGLTEGSYSYVDPNGVLQQYKYESDENGYRVSGTNLPAAPAPTGELPQPVQDTPEVAAAKAAHRIAYDEAKKAADASPDGDDDGSSDSGVAVDAPAAPAAAVVQASKTAVAAPPPVHSSYGYSAYVGGAYPSYHVAPVAAYAYAAPPVVGPYAYAPYAVGSYSPVHGQYHSQDELGQYSYGYSSDTSSKAEVKTLDGVTRGGYSYVDPDGRVQQYQYVSDPVNGFRVSGTNLPSNAL